MSRVLGAWWPGATMRGLGAGVLGCWVLSPGVTLSAQAQGVTAVTFDEAIRTATAKHPTVAEAAASILRAQGLLDEARAAGRPRVSGSVTTTTLNTGVTFDDITVTPRNQVAASLTVDVPLVAASTWARRALADDGTRVAEAGAAEARRQVALATADAYLTVVAERRAVSTEARARDVAQAHFALATDLERAGSGSRVDTLRAEQQVSTAEVRLERARLGLYRSQEGLGVLLVADGPIDAGDEPAFETPQAATATPTSLLQFRTDLRYFSAQQDLAARAVSATDRESWPTLDAIFQPQAIYPAPFFTTANSWQFLLRATIPIYTGGDVAGRRTERQAELDAARARLAQRVSQATAEVRVAREAAAISARALTSARASADQASQVVDITTLSFRAGAATSIEVIDAERTARDAETAVAIAEDALRRARLDLLIALGQFP